MTSLAFVKALHCHLQCFALADAKLCVGDCNALRWRLQSIATCKALNQLQSSCKREQNLPSLLEQFCRNIVPTSAEPNFIFGYINNNV